MFCASFGSGIIHSLSRPTHLTRGETFAGAACLTKFAVNQRAREKYRGVFLVRPKAAPLQAPIRRFANWQFRQFDSAAGLSTLSNRSTVAVETPDQHSLGVVE